MRNPNRHWEFFPQILRRLQSSELHRTQVAADVKSSAPPTQPQGKPSQKAPAAPLTTGDGTTGAVDAAATKAAAKKEKAAAKAATAAAAAAALQTQKPTNTTGKTKGSTKDPTVLSFVTAKGELMTSSQQLNSLGQATKG